MRSHTKYGVRWRKEDKMPKFIKLTKYNDLQVIVNVSEVRTMAQYSWNGVRYTQIINNTCTYEGINQTPEQIYELMKNAEEV